MGTLTLSNPLAKLKVEAVRAQLGLPPPKVPKPPRPEWAIELLRRADEVTFLARTRFPAFRPFRPLAIGVHRELTAIMEAEGYSAGDVDAFLRRWTRQPGYLRTCIPGAARVNLQGEPDGIVTEKGARYAAALLKRRTKTTAAKA